MSAHEAERGQDLPILAEIVGLLDGDLLLVDPRADALGLEQRLDFAVVAGGIETLGTPPLVSLKSKSSGRWAMTRSMAPFTRSEKRGVRTLQSFWGFVLGGREQEEAAGDGEDAGAGVGVAEATGVGSSASVAVAGREGEGRTQGRRAMDQESSPWKRSATPGPDATMQSFRWVARIDM